MNAALVPTVLYEDGDIIALNKPAGLIVHPDGRTDEPSLCDWLLSQYPFLAGVGEPLTLPDGTVLDRPGIVHRLDRGTSGVLLIAKHQAAYQFLKLQFQAHAIEKVYHAIVYGVMQESSGRINRPIGRSGADFRRWSAQRGTTGPLREALTEFKTLARCNREPVTGKPLSVVALHPVTGRTHQLRVHCKAINHPIVSDSLYAPNQPKLLGFERPALHAHHITFTAMDDSSQTVEAPYPPDFAAAKESLASVGVVW